MRNQGQNIYRTLCASWQEKISCERGRATLFSGRYAMRSDQHPTVLSAPRGRDPVRGGLGNKNLHFNLRPVLGSISLNCSPCPSRGSRRRRVTQTKSVRKTQRGSVEGDPNFVFGPDWGAVGPSTHDSCDSTQSNPARTLDPTVPSAPVPPRTISAYLKSACSPRPQGAVPPPSSARFHTASQ